MAWCKLEDTVRYHYKFGQLADTLGVRRAEARGLFLGLCSWALVNAPDGLLTGFAQSVIEEGADWQGRRGRLVDALLHAGLLDKLADGALEIHDFFQRAESNRKATQKRRERNVARQSPDSRPTVAKMSPSRGEERRGEDIEPPIIPLAQISKIEQASEEFDSRAEAGAAAKEYRATRQDEVFAETEWIEAEKANGLPGVPLGERDRRLLGEIIRRCAEAKVERRKVFAEWFRAEWRSVFGSSLSQLAKRTRDVVSAMADPKLRPKVKTDKADAPPPGFRAIPSADETAERLRRDKHDEAMIAADQEGQAKIKNIKAMIRENLR